MEKHIQKVSHLIFQQVYYNNVIIVMYFVTIIMDSY